MTIVSDRYVTIVSDRYGTIVSDRTVTIEVTEAARASSPGPGGSFD